MPLNTFFSNFIIFKGIFKNDYISGRVIILIECVMLLWILTLGDKERIEKHISAVYVAFGVTLINM